VSVLNYLFAGGALHCLAAADVNDDGEIGGKTGSDIVDASFLLSYLFANGPNHEPPFPSCGIDSTSDELLCESYDHCP